MEKKCKCNNIGACTRAGKVFVFKDEDAEFVCPECGEPLEEVKDVDTSLEEATNQLKTKKKKNAIVLGLCSIGVVAALIGGIIWFTGGEEEKALPPQPDPDKVAAVQKGDSVIKVNEQKLADNTDKVKPEFVQALNALLDEMRVAVKDSIMEKVNALEVPINTAWENAFLPNPPAPQPNGGNESTPKAGGNKEPKATGGGSSASASGTKDLGYAVYKGTLKNGKPDGVNGRLTFKTQHVIDSKDPKGRVAEAGDYVIGEFVDGHLVQGRWYGADNTLKGGIMIGM